ncbi:programmed cell death 1 ligand 2 [Oryzias latipes]|uniref:programmed cell death 1 ligand 2 n=1 Tax=Oryzias latipes TaxID=8090 RepID=UPI0009DA5840|nr:programmed cell death 1 ligand 2 [Oryzias latipes]XP_020563391.1 programmed cell death 1 ligand 2 [Oryzias latipes]
MDWVFAIILQVMIQPSLSVLFTVEAEQTMYSSEFGGEVVMGCRFSKKATQPNSDLKVTWHWTSSGLHQELIRLDNTADYSVPPKYQGRVKLLTEELKNGWAKLQLSNLRINDSGTYQCLVQTTDGTDYKTMTLSVKAPYKTVTKRIERAEQNKVLLTCESEGYPKSEVVWTDGNLQNQHPNTSFVSTPEQLFKITSQILVSSSEENNYTCSFKSDKKSTTFYIPDDLPTPPEKSDAVIIVVLTVLIIVIMAAGGILYYKRKAFRTIGTTKCLPVDPDSSVSGACLQKEKEIKNVEIDMPEDTGLY